MVKTRGFLPASMSSRFLIAIGTVLCALVLGAQYHPTSATTSVITSSSIDPGACNRLVPRNVTECHPSSAEWTLSTPLSTRYDTLTSQPTMTQTRSDNSPTGDLTSITPTQFAAVATITCTAATAMPRLQLSNFHIFGVAMLGLIQGLVL